LNKSESEPPSELEIFLAYIDPLFQKIADETNNHATLQLNNAYRNRLKGNDKWFEIIEDELTAYVALLFCYPTSTNVLLTMCEPLLDIRLTLYLDNWHSSPDLYR
jgi:hypothetical protein